MPTFVYKAVDLKGQEISDTLAASSRAMVIDQLVKKGLYPVSVDERRESTRLGAGIFSRTGHVSKASVEGFTRELANLLAAGVPLSRALSILTNEAAQPAAKKQWAAIHDDTMGGMSLADALERWPRSFPPVYLAMVRAGETGGFLDVVLGQIADFRSREQDLKGRVKAALVYPTVLAVLASLILTFLLTYFIPRFSAIFAEFGGALPWLTRAIVAASRIVVNYWFVLFILLALAVVGVRRALVSESGRRVFERSVLRLPVFGEGAARFALVRFCRMLGTLVGAGVPLVTSLRVAKEAIGNQTLADAVNQAIEKVQRGSPLGRSLAGCPQLFPSSVVEMVSVAEESGRLDKELVRMATVYEAELDRKLRMMVALAEPALLFIMAAIVGTIVIGMLLPVFTLQEFIR
jgi:general secretion pathway protein F